MSGFKIWPDGNITPRDAYVATREGGEKIWKITGPGVFSPIHCDSEKQADLILQYMNLARDAGIAKVQKALREMLGIST